MMLTSEASDSTYFAAATLYRAAITACFAVYAAWRARGQVRAHYKAQRRQAKREHKHKERELRRDRRRRLHSSSSSSGQEQPPPMAIPLSPISSLSAADDKPDAVNHKPDYDRKIQFAQVVSQEYRIV